VAFEGSSLFSVESFRTENGNHFEVDLPVAFSPKVARPSQPLGFATESRWDSTIYQ
jgi:hypothetical protein